LSSSISKLVICGVNRSFSGEYIGAYSVLTAIFQVDLG